MRLVSPGPEGRKYSLVHRYAVQVDPRIPPSRTSMATALLQEKLTRQIIGAYYRVYNGLGFGFLESVYANALELELRSDGLLVQRERPIRVRYRGCSIGEFRADLVVQGVVLVEIKATKSLEPHARQQTLNYLRGTDLEVGLLLHFGPKPHFERLVSTTMDSRRSVGPPAAAGGIREDQRPSVPGAEEPDER